MVDKLIKVLESWVGYLEKASNENLEDKTANAGSGNYTIFGKRYDEYMNCYLNGQAWCAMFVSICFVEAFGLAKAKELLCGELYAYCPYGMTYFKNKEQLYTTPKKGDIIYFLKNGIAYHTGVVYKVSGNTVYTIEGNTSGGSGVVANGGGVFKKSYTVTSNMRFGRPKYTTESATAGTQAQNKTEAKYSSTAWVKALQEALNVTVDGVAGTKTLAACPELQNGSTGTVVKLMQQRIGEEFKITVSGGYDGDFGSGTEAAVRAFQKAKGLEVDGIVGENTWGALLGLTAKKKQPYETAFKFDKAVAATYKLTTDQNLQEGAGKGKDIIKKLPKNSTVICYGYYNEVAGVNWLLVVAGTETGYVNSKYLART